jgi:hypothetical protein
MICPSPFFGVLKSDNSEIKIRKTMKIEREPPSIRTLSF